ncbi:NADPH-dependent F420 reductase [Microbacterium sp. NPDC090003]|uniref:NADPH-dependent F420 reductase n=1 Tax=Microbacterium sp. NPDC090003 TaxID=3364203 RepID=UPI00381A6245
MKIGIIGAGNIGRILAERLAREGHEVSIANSRGPETVDASALSTGATAVWAADATNGADVVIVSVNFGQLPTVAGLVAEAPENAVIVDTSNYFPLRDGEVEGFEDGQVESEWVQKLYGRPIVKAWNTITTASFRDKAYAKDPATRIALPIAADDDTQRAVGMGLVEETGFDVFDAGVIADTWRQQPGTPVYTNDLTADELPAALDRAQRDRSRLRRDLMMKVYLERIEADGKEPDPERQLALTRAIF